MRRRSPRLSVALRTETMTALRAAWQEQLQAERDLAAARGEQYAQVIDLGARWDTGAPLPHLVSDGSRAFVVCLARQRDPDWDGSYVTVVAPGDRHESLFVVVEFRGCRDIRFGGPNDEAISGHPLDGKGLEAYRAHEVLNSQWIEQAITVNSVHPQYSRALFGGLRHFVLLFHDDMLEALASGIEARLIKGTMRAILADLTSNLVE
jgi:hypothetical protein